MSIPGSTWVLLLSGILLNAAAQLALKAGTNTLGSLVVPGQNWFTTITRILFQPYVFGGLVMYVVSAAIWIVVLSKIPVSVAYPLLSIGYIINMIAAFLLFGEALTVSKVIGVGVIVFGVFLVARG